MPWTPLAFVPILKRIIWGGRRLGTDLGKAIGPESDYAESWEVADHQHGQSIVARGPFAGRSLNDLVRTFPRELLGAGHESAQQFPLLMKFIDARDVLSVQVHPNDEQGQRLAQDNGKTEAWVVVASEPGGLIYAGLRPGVDRAAFEQAIANGAVEPLLHRFVAKAGDCVYIPAGTLHAIGAGVLLAEVQQMSDATFRVHDWGRLGADGHPRALHLAQALEVTDFARGPVDPVLVRAEPLPARAGTLEPLIRCPYFALDRLRLSGAATVGGADRFTILVGVKGSAVVGHEGKSYDLPVGGALLLPAAVGPCLVEAGDAEILTCGGPR